MGDTATGSGEPSTRSVYVITYSHADLDKVPDKATFVEIVTTSFHNNGVARVVQYACALEQHRDGTPHFHAVIKLDRQKRWRSVRNHLNNHYGIAVNFSNEFSNYYDGYQYVSKDDPDVLHSENHPALSNPYRTRNATQARRQGQTQRSRTRKRAFDAVDLADLVEMYHIRDKTELLNVVKKQKVEGKRDLALYVFNNIEKSVKLIHTVWEMHNAAKVIQRRTTERMQVLNEALQGDCVADCEGRWLTMAKETLGNNDIPLRKYAGAVSEAIEKGRGKDWNILLVGGGNCAKTFMLKPLRKIFQTFSNPATGSFAWLGVEKAEMIFLNDFRWDKTLISWKDFLLLLEGDELHFPAPKTSYSEDILFDRDTPIFCTADECFKKGANCPIENYMMTLRWVKFEFIYEIPRNKIVKINPCGRCFADLILNN